MNEIVPVDASAALTPPASGAAGGGFMEAVGAFFARVGAAIAEAYRAIAASGALSRIVLVLVIVVGAALLVALALRLFKRAMAAIPTKAAPRELHIRSWKIASPEQSKQISLRVVSYLRILAVAAIASLGALALSLVLAPDLSAQVLVFARGAWLGLATALAWITALQAVLAIGASVLAAIASKEHVVKPLKYKSFTILSAEIIEKGLVTAIRIVGWIAAAVSAAMVLAMILSYFSFTWSWSRAILSVFSSVIKPVLDAIIAYIPKFFAAVVIVLVAQVINRLLKAFFTEIAAGRLGFARFDQDWAMTTYKILRFVIIMLTIVMVFPYIPGSNSDAFRSVGIFLGVILSLGSSSFVGNIMGGISLTYMNSFRMGDRVSIGDVTGDVIEKSLFVTRLRTIKNEVVTIPNAVVLSKQVENYSSRRPNEKLILHTEVTIGYDVPWRDVHAALIEAAASVKGLLADPPPFVLQRALDSYAVRYELNVYTADPWRMVIAYSELHQSIQDCFAREDIEIMTPMNIATRDAPIRALPPAPGEDERPSPGTSLDDTRK